MLVTIFIGIASPLPYSNSFNPYAKLEGIPVSQERRLRHSQVLARVEVKHHGEYRATCTSRAEGRDVRRVHGGDPTPWLALWVCAAPTLGRVAPAGHPDSKRGSQLPVLRGSGGRQFVAHGFG